MSLFEPRQLEMIIVGDLAVQICPACGLSIGETVLRSYLVRGGGYQGRFTCRERTVWVTHLPYLINELEVELAQI